MTDFTVIDHKSENPRTKQTSGHSTTYKWQEHKTFPMLIKDAYDRLFVPGLLVNPATIFHRDPKTEQWEW